VAERVAITREELALILEALDDAAFYRDARSRVLKSATRKRRLLASSPTIADPEGSADVERHRRQTQAYAALATRLKAELPAGPDPS
jgi:hypothetical protein